MAKDPKPPSNTSTLYNALHAAAIELVRSQDQDLTQSTRISIQRVRAIRGDNFTHTFGHNYFISTKPPFLGSLDLDCFIAHLNTMLPQLESWDTYITDVVVDEARKMCVVRASYYMKAKGAEEDEVVENDLVWWLWMSEDGTKVKRSMEFVDGVASARLGEMMMRGPKV